MPTRFVNLRVPGSANETKRVEIVVDAGRFFAIEEPGTRPAGSESRVDLGGRLVLPGVVDGHVHFDDPGFTHREDFETGTRSAAAGGVTTVVDMPCTSLPPVTTAAAFRHKLAVVAPKAHVDFMFWGGVSKNAVEEAGWKRNVSALAAEGVAGFKLYMLSGMETFRDLSPELIRKVLKEIARHGVPAGIHAEDKEYVQALTFGEMADHRTGPLDYADSRPAEAEVLAVETLRGLCRETGATVHVVHLASGEALDVVIEARAEGLPFSAETCPHYLAFTREDLSRLGALLKTAPVVKNASDRDRLWKGLADGDIQHVATDHAAGEWPHEKATGSIWSDHGGVPGVETLLPYLLGEGVKKRRITLERLVELTSAAPARFFGVSKRKGAIAAGFDADFVVVDEDERFTVRAALLHCKNRYTPFDGWNFTGRVRETWVRGERVYRREADGTESFAPPGTGRFLRREEPVRSAPGVALAAATA
jgi:allantoinase